MELSLGGGEFLRLFLERRALPLLDPFQLAYALVLGLRLLPQTRDLIRLLFLRADVAILALP